MIIQMENASVKIEVVSRGSSYLPILREIFLQGRREIDPIGSMMMKLDDFEKETAGEYMLVAINDQTPIGFISIWIADNFIHHLYVDKSKQRKGVGRLLLQKALTLMNGTIKLKCFVSNRSALDFYRREGFRIEETMESESGDFHLLILVLPGPDKS